MESDNSALDLSSSKESDFTAPDLNSIHFDTINLSC
jgi:hypothetical protein